MQYGMWMVRGGSSETGPRRRMMGGWNLLTASGLGLLYLAVGGVQAADAVAPAPAPAPVVGAEAPAVSPAEAPALLMLTAESLQAAAAAWVPEQLKALGRKDGDPSVLIELKPPEGNDLAKVDVSGITTKLAEALNSAAGKAAYFRYRALRPKTERPVMEKPMQEPDFVLTLTLGKAMQAQPEGEVTMLLGGMLTAFKKEDVLWSGSHDCPMTLAGKTVAGLGALAISAPPAKEPVVAGPYEMTKFATQKNADGMLQVSFVMANTSAEAQSVEVTAIFLDQDRKRLAEDVATQKLQFEPKQSHTVTLTAHSKEAVHYLLDLSEPDGAEVKEPAPAAVEEKPLTRTQRVDVAADELIEGTGIRAADLNDFADKIAAAVTKAEGLRKGDARTPVVVVFPPQNRTTQQSDGTLLSVALQNRMNATGKDKMKVVNRSNLDEAIAEEEKKKGYNYYVKCTLMSATARQGAAESNYVLVTAQLINAESTEVVAQVESELRKTAKAVDGDR